MIKIGDKDDAEEERIEEEKKDRSLVQNLSPTHAGQTTTKTNTHSHTHSLRQ